MYSFYIRINIFIYIYINTYIYIYIYIFTWIFSKKDRSIYYLSLYLSNEKNGKKKTKGKIIKIIHKINNTCLAKFQLMLQVVKLNSNEMIIEIILQDELLKYFGR